MIPLGSSAAILIFENRWATPFIRALRRGETQLVATGYIPQDDLAARLDAAVGLKGDRYAASPRHRTHRRHRRDGHRCRQSRVAPRAESLGPTRRPAVRETAAPAAIRRPPPQAAALSRDQVAQLKDLAELKSQGILTDAEFDAQKAKILAS